MGKAGYTGVHTILTIGAEGWIWPAENDPLPPSHRRWSADKNDPPLTNVEFDFKRYELELLVALAKCHRGVATFKQLPQIPQEMADMIRKVGSLEAWLFGNQRRTERFWKIVREQNEPKLVPRISAKRNKQKRRA